MMVEPNSAATYTAPAGDRHSAFAQLKGRIKEAGLLDPQPGYYVAMFTLTALLLACSLVILFTAHSLWLQLLDAVFLAFVCTQIAFLGHDTGHREVFRRRRNEAAVGLILGNLLLGVSRAWWNGNHNAHHSHPNDVDHDPAVDIGILAFTEEQARSKRGIARAIVKYQHILLLPLFCLEMINLHRQSVETIVGRKPIPYRRLEAALMGIHVVGYCLLIFLPLGLLHGLLFIAVHKAATGLYMGSVFAPNHKGMPVFEAGEPIDFLHRQVLTARNVRGNLLVAYWYGGLNYQIEHHLFPAMPRNRLGQAQAIVKDFCAEQGILYYETGMIQSYREILQSFREVSQVLRQVERV